MRQSLDKTLRNQLEKVVVRARELIEKAASEALIRLGVETAEAPAYLNDNERKLRNRLRAHARQLGDKLQANGVQSIEHLRAEVSYEHWHRMLFARFLEQNNLLMLDKYLAVTLADCQEYAQEEGCKDGWELAGKLAQRMLPQVFRADSPVFELQIPVDRIRELEELVLTLPGAVFEAQDSLGWCYQFWQSKRKKEVNGAGIPIGADELSPVTQLFTEPYMVSFLLDNSLGAWWAKKQLTDADLRSASDEKTLRQAAAIEGVPLEYLRFVKTSDEQGELWQAAGGWFDGWPQEVRALKTLDPCCGSGHFLVALFLMLVPMRMQLEGLDARSAVDKVLADNLHGLELDSRCVEIAAFALALEAWRYPNAGGYRTLPALNIACSGLDVSAATQEWLALAKHNPDISEALNWFTRTFKDAPVLGSLIDVNTAYYEGKTEGKASPWQVLLDAKAATDDEAKTAEVTAQGLAVAAKLLSGSYNLVATNVPYLARGKQCDTLQNFCENYFPEAKADLATVFLERCVDFSPAGGTSTIVLPQNWLFLTSYTDFRKKLLTEDTWNLVARLGAGAFETISGEVVQAILVVLNRGPASLGNMLHGIDVSGLKATAKKAEQLLVQQFRSVLQAEQLEKPDARISLNSKSSSALVNNYADTATGMQSFDRPRFIHYFWEMSVFSDGWEPCQSTVRTTSHMGGCEYAVLWENGQGQLYKMMEQKRVLENYTSAIWKAGSQYWGTKGVMVSLMGNLPVSLYLGRPYDQNAGLIKPDNEDSLLSLWAYCSSGEYSSSVREVDQALKVTNATLGKIEFDHELWLSVAKVKYPNGLPKIYTSDPTQWIYHGHPCGSVIWDEEKKWTVIADKRTDETVLQVAVARLLGYRWPAELDDEMELADEMLHWLGKSDDLLRLVDDDGIVCLPALRGERAAASRLEAMLQAAYEEDWSSSVLSDLLASVGSKSLETWLRDKFFEQHCKLFQHRPFIWQIWDGLKDGFSVLVNYHKLNYQGLERLIYTYLGDWIRTQEHGFKEGIDGAESRLMAAKNLKDSLEAILKGDAITGKSGLDIFVRWKPLHEQPMGWNPDLNDGVRLNIRPFMQAPDVDKKGAGVLRTKPNIKWGKDRGNDVESAPWYYLGLQYGEKEGARINDHHISLADKQAARDEYENKENHG
ncbi:Eco57I restriction-modification methylase domain-containing protein [Enterobacter hormaechei]|uniref:site-specific DNA-methyltransferase (adenine-specific) n=1 Tax=Enterobacter hormaechei subsp. xiangfangensis TaxID=1296536 RepID=A0A837FCP3_9ENTR|nr:N-6 DNA methylase [Enterobacter hormaechei]MCD9796963.1 BREX-1 system adenine-specific DNA-methyltransferase PglX [Klebsiella pneumoniae]KJM68911.1 restriction endonuclease subunit M [Enterobacter hormaechei subsp. xiangfangensis]HAS1804183.1 SAM-dependent DNA methyltransferase [Enterobacter hormaechei subsp. xiangfangensis]HAS1807806.1 SAM-dependent DNA methyltransferase [Enterobacter hormaechei subsp. xiangfangensis]HAS1820915.1 SAM-dependent DNA methyltransferase [Enterobacter hormaechei